MRTDELGTEFHRLADSVGPGETDQPLGVILRTGRRRRARRRVSRSVIGAFTVAIAIVAATAISHHVQGTSIQATGAPELRSAALATRRADSLRFVATDTYDGSVYARVTGLTDFEQDRGQATNHYGEPGDSPLSNRVDVRWIDGIVYERHTVGRNTSTWSRHAQTANFDASLGNANAFAPTDITAFLSALGSVPGDVKNLGLVTVHGNGLDHLRLITGSNEANDAILGPPSTRIHGFKATFQIDFWTDHKDRLVQMTIGAHHFPGTGGNHHVWHRTILLSNFGVAVHVSPPPVG